MTRSFSTKSYGSPAPKDRACTWAVFLAFLRLGLTSFGGPMAHLGDFRAEFVERRKWLNDASYSELVALCQFLPGPASSQIGIAIGLLRAGWFGSLAAWLGFTLPSALLLIAFAYGIARHADLAQSGAVHGLKIAAVAIVAQAVWGMAKSLCTDGPRVGLALGAALVTLALPGTAAQLAAIALSALGGFWLIRLPDRTPVAQASYGVSPRAGTVALGVFLALLIGLPVLAGASGSRLLAGVDGVYRAGALVFGGGHVVLPLLQSAMPEGMVSHADFLAGYGAAQAVPGPLFTFAAYLGAVASGPLSGWAGGAVFLVTIFVPACLLVVGALPFWNVLARRTSVRNAMAGVNAGVVGILLSALYDPVWTTAVHSHADFGLALAAFALLVYARWPPLCVVALTATGAWLLS